MESNLTARLEGDCKSNQNFKEEMCPKQKKKAKVLVTLMWCKKVYLNQLVKI